tara:strand:- start:111 stop:248 length:138 start_codon:yes stop_codon:yes gene_type:complete
MRAGYKQKESFLLPSARYISWMAVVNWLKNHNDDFAFLDINGNAR